MFDFRYHAVSLAAVLVALAVGVLLGVAIGDAGLVSSAEKQVRSSLRDDVRNAQTKEAESAAALRAERRYVRASYPFVVARRLQGLRVGLLFLGDSNDRIASEVRSALAGSGGRLTGTLAMRQPPDTQALADGAGRGRYSQIDQSDRVLRSFGRTIGREMILGGRLIRREARTLFSSRAGDLGPFDAVVVARVPRTLSGSAAASTNALEGGVVAGLGRTRASIVGVQLTTTQPSQVAWYRARGLSSVNNIDQTSGQAALVLALAGAEGSFGSGAGVGALLPGPESAVR
ncbi:MAG: hypothetical protein F2813_04025 [Actinobacteria bacterium]|uniref:Unannotated protein n=1 Tax=freshwater metagenome TaxID=449393 RepID=A0A6J5ZW12_9ZZZZ|nr:hypothetical protein [Actinomycetota bacterium]